MKNRFAIALGCLVASIAATSSATTVVQPAVIGYAWGGAVTSAISRYDSKVCAEVSGAVTWITPLSLYNKTTGSVTVYQTGKKGVWFSGYQGIANRPYGYKTSAWVSDSRSVTVSWTNPSEVELVGEINLAPSGAIGTTTAFTNTQISSEDPSKGDRGCLYAIRAVW